MSVGVNPGQDPVARAPQLHHADAGIAEIR